MMPSMRFTPRPAESWRSASVTTGRFLTVQSPTVSELMRDCPTSACSPPENVPCTSPNCGRPSSLAKSVSSATSDPPGIDEEGDLVAAVDAHADHRQRTAVQELQPRRLPVALHIIGRLALETFQLRDIQRRILRNDQRVGADVDDSEAAARVRESLGILLDERNR